MRVIQQLDRPGVVVWQNIEHGVKIKGSYSRKQWEFSNSDAEGFPRIVGVGQRGGDETVELPVVRGKRHGLAVLVLCPG